MVSTEYERRLAKLMANNSGLTEWPKFMHGFERQTQ